MCDGNDEDASTIAMELMMHYKDKCLIPCAANVAMFIRDVKSTVVVIVHLLIHLSVVLMSE